MLTRREFLLAGAAIALPGGTAVALEFDGANERYQRWLVQLNDDLSKLNGAVKGPGGVSEDDIEKWCAKSIVPKSRAALQFSQWLTEVANTRARGQQGRRYADVGSVALRVLESSVPAGYGGLFPEPAGGRFPSNRYSVWYTHIDGGDLLKSYFDDKQRFPLYQLPPAGTLKRKAYPFLLFEDATDSIRLAGISAEWMGAVVQLYNVQFF